MFPSQPQISESKPLRYIEAGIGPQPRSYSSLNPSTVRSCGTSPSIPQLQECSFSTSSSFSVSAIGRLISPVATVPETGGPICSSVAVRLLLMSSRRHSRHHRFTRQRSLQIVTAVLADTDGLFGGLLNHQTPSARRPRLRCLNSWHCSGVRCGTT